MRIRIGCILTLTACLLAGHTQAEIPARQAWEEAENARYPRF
ncbi:MAG: hypothetical protein ACK4FE_15545 [Azonexus sp.]